MLTSSTKHKVYGYNICLAELNILSIYLLSFLLAVLIQAIYKRLYIIEFFTFVYV